MLSFLSNTLKRREGQGLVEYAMLLGFVIAFIMAVRGFFTTRLSGMVTDQVNILRGSVNSANEYATTTNTHQESDYESNASGSGAEMSNVDSDSTQNTVTVY